MTAAPNPQDPAEAARFQPGWTPRQFTTGHTTPRIEEKIRLAQELFVRFANDTDRIIIAKVRAQSSEIDQLQALAESAFEYAEAFYKVVDRHEDYVAWCQEQDDG